MLLFHLHSTIFILKQMEAMKAEIKKLNLHSTIFILKHAKTIGLFKDLTRFTFYNIYIKTLQFLSHYDNQSYLHSTIFILKLDKALLQHKVLFDLHSTIFILKPGQEVIKKCPN